MFQYIIGYMLFLKTIFLIITEFNLLHFNIINISPVIGFKLYLFDKINGMLLTGF